MTTDEGTQTNLEFNNLMENIVMRYVDDIMVSMGCCTCDYCKSDVIAYALNHLPPKYVSTRIGKLMVKMNSFESQFRADVISALTEAATLVRANPRHDARG